jgi:hypothetical protein
LESGLFTGLQPFGIKKISVRLVGLFQTPNSQPHSFLFAISQQTCLLGD